MARKAKATAEYFSHNCKQGKVAFIMQQYWGNDGYAAFFKLYERLGDSEGHFIDCKVDGEWDFLVSYLMIAPELVSEMIGKLCNIGVIDRELWYQGQVIWSQSFVDDLDVLYSRREIARPAKPDLCQHKSLSRGFMSTGIPVTGQSDDRNPYSRVEYSKEEKTKDLKKAAEGGKPPAPSGEGKALLSLKKLSTLDDQAARAHLHTMCDRLYRTKIFPQAQAFTNSYLKKRFNPRAILHTLVRCSVHARDDPWAFCTKIIRVENGNYNEQEFIREAEKHNVGREEAAKILGELGFSL